jgi:hypothetical protein
MGTLPWLGSRIASYGTRNSIIIVPLIAGGKEAGRLGAAELHNPEPGNRRRQKEKAAHSHWCADSDQQAESRTTGDWTDPHWGLTLAEPLHPSKF